MTYWYLRHIENHTAASSLDHSGLYKPDSVEWSCFLALLYQDDVEEKVGDMNKKFFKLSINIYV